MASAVSPSTTLWVKAEPFTFGALPIAPHPRLTVSNIKRIVSYAKNKGKLGFPKLNYQVWKHIALKKLELPMDIAWMYFTTYRLISDEQETEERIEWDDRLSQCMSSSETEAIRNQMSVNTMRFVLFLYIQQLHRISLRASLVSANDEWPMRSRSPSPDCDSSRSGGKCMDEQAHLTFVRNNLDEIMELLVEPDSYSAGGDGGDLTLSIEAIEALGFLIGGSVDRNRTIKPLQDIALMQQMHQKTGYSKVNVETSRSSKGLKLVISRSFSHRSLHTWLKQHLDMNPYGFATCVAAGRRLSWPLGGTGAVSGELPSKPGRIATNAVSVPKDFVRGNKLIIMSQVCRQTVARSSGTLENSGMKVHRCHNSYIYLLSPLRFVSIEKCRHSTIVLGAVETAVHVSHCEGCIIIAACRRFTISNSNNVTIHLLTPNRPLVFSGNSRLTFAPYNTYYGTLEEHLTAAGIGTKLNEWDKPLSVGGPEHSEENHAAWELMPPDNYFIFSVPFVITGTTTSVPVTIPALYQAALNRKDKQVEHWQRSLRGLNRDQKAELQKIVEQRFQDWLATTGQRRELDTLSVTKTPSQSSSSS